MPLQKKNFLFIYLFGTYQKKHSEKMVKEMLRSSKCERIYVLHNFMTGISKKVIIFLDGLASVFFDSGLPPR